MKEIKGLTQEEVNERINKNLINYIDEPKTKTVKEIIRSNVFTYFNFLNILLGSLVIISGIISGRFLYSLKNSLFVGVIFTNTIISIIEEILAKKLYVKDVSMDDIFDSYYLNYVDLNSDGTGTMNRYKKKSFDWYKQVISSNGEKLD